MFIISRLYCSLKKVVLVSDGVGEVSLFRFLFRQIAVTATMRGERQIQNQSGAIQERFFRTRKGRPELAVALVVEGRLVDRPAIIRDSVWNKSLMRRRETRRFEKFNNEQLRFRLPPQLRHRSLRRARSKLPRSRSADLFVSSSPCLFHRHTSPPVWRSVSPSRPAGCFRARSGL